MITDRHVFFNEKEYTKALHECRRLEADGWIKVPDWFSIPTDGYEYELPGQIWAYMKPKPKWRHVFRYKILCWPKHAYWEWRQRQSRHRID